MKIHTRSLDCDNPYANKFLQQLAEDTAASYLLCRREDILAEEPAEVAVIEVSLRGLNATAERQGLVRRGCVCTLYSK